MVKAIETARDAVLDMRETTQAANTVIGRQSLIRVVTPGWLAVLYHDGRHEIDQAAQFREKALREIEVMFEGLGGKSTKVSAKPAKSGRLDFLKKVFVS